MLASRTRAWANGCCVPCAVCTIATTPHTLLGSALSLLLVFRTNASYSRLVEGRRVRLAIAIPPRSQLAARSSHSPDISYLGILPHTHSLCACMRQSSQFLAFGEWRRQQMSTAKVPEVRLIAVADVGTAGPQCAGVDPHDSCLLPQGAARRVSGLCAGAESPTPYCSDAARLLKKGWRCSMGMDGLVCWTKALAAKPGCEVAGSAAVHNHAPWQKPTAAAAACRHLPYQ